MKCIVVIIFLFVIYCYTSSAESDDPGISQFAHEFAIFEDCFLKRFGRNVQNIICLKNTNVAECICTNRREVRDQINKTASACVDKASPYFVQAVKDVGSFIVPTGLMSLCGHPADDHHPQLKFSAKVPEKVRYYARQFSKIGACLLQLLGRDLQNIICRKNMNVAQCICTNQDQVNMQIKKNVEICADIAIGNSHTFHFKENGAFILGLKVSSFCDPIKV